MITVSENRYGECAHDLGAHVGAGHPNSIVQDAPDLRAQVRPMIVCEVRPKIMGAPGRTSGFQGSDQGM
jgi:hypothetical protein